MIDTESVGFDDPAVQKKTADTILTQLGIHPNQAGIRNLLDTHLQSVTNQKEQDQLNQQYGPAIQDMLNPGSSSDLVPSGGPSAEPATPAANPETPTPTVSAPVGNGLAPMAPLIPPSLQGHKDRLETLEREGSGIHQIHNPLLRGLATGGELAGDLISPGTMALTPGTNSHHQLLVNNEQTAINNEEATASKEAARNLTNVRSRQVSQIIPKVNELTLWRQQNPDADINEFWKAKAAARPGGKLTPEEQVMKYLTTPVEKGGKGLLPDDAWDTVLGMRLNNKPQTPGALKNEVMGLIAKTMPSGTMNPKVMEDPATLAKLIEDSPALTDTEKGKVYAYLATTSTPADTAHNQAVRAAAPGQYREYSTIDRDTGNLGLTPPNTINKNPGQYIPAAQGGSSMSREALFSELHYNTKQVRQAYESLQNGFDTFQRAQLALALRSTDIHSAVSAFLQSSVGQTLKDDQVDLVTALASLHENAMAMRTIQGLGSGSDEMRDVIRATVPGAGTPNLNYARRQLDLLEGTIARAEQAVPRSGVKKPKLPENAPKTGSHDKPASGNVSKTFTREQVQAQVDAYNKAHPDQPITFDDAVRDLKAKGHKLSN